MLGDINIPSSTSLIAALCAIPASVTDFVGCETGSSAI